MNNNSSRSNLINLALIYNYLVNKEDKLSVDIINKYIELINKYLVSQYKNEVNNKDKDDNNKDTYNYRYITLDNIEYIKLNTDYINLEDIYLESIYRVEDYILNTTLYEKVLNLLNIKRCDLPIESFLERKQDNIDVIWSSKDMASNVVRKHLVMKGMKNIQINGVRQTIYGDDIGYRVFVTYDYPCEYLNVSKFNECINSKNKRLIMK